MNIINAFTPKQEVVKETQSHEMHLFYTIVFDGLPCDELQEKIRFNIKAGKQFPSIFIKEKSNLDYSFIENPNAINPPNNNIDNNIIRHLSYTISLSPFSGKKYLDQIEKVKRTIENDIDVYILDILISKINVYFYVVGYNQGCFISNIVNSINEYENDEVVISTLRKYFNFENFLSNPKVKVSVENIATFEKVGFLEMSDSDGLGKIITDYQDYKSEEKTIKKYDDYPSEQNISIYDAILMCQHTYDSEEAADKSILSIIYSVFTKKEKKVSQSNERVKIIVDNDIYKNIESNYKSRILEKNWVATGAEWQKVSSVECKNEIKIDNSSRLTGFYSQLYKKIENDKIVGYAYCTAGTEPSSANDWIFANFLQGLTGISLQHTLSVRNAKKIDKYCKDVPLFFIGHSLGGGLASNNALVTIKRHAITFNAAGLNPLRIMATLFINNREAFCYRESQKRIHPFIIDGEIVQSLRHIGQAAVSAGTLNENRFYQDTQIVNENKKGWIGNFFDFITNRKKKKDSQPTFEMMGSIERHAVTNFLRIKDLSQLKLKQE